jgi:DNA segregation ATPase FtsK/SpoIIIE, S-DNA-T family
LSVTFEEVDPWPGGAIQLTPMPESNARRPRSTAKGAAPESKELGRKEATGVILLLLGTLLLLALLSYDRNDLPTWLPFHSTDRPNIPAHNFLGPFGAICAAFLFHLIGAAAFLLPAGAVWFGVSQFQLALPLYRRTLTGFALSLVSAACLLSVQTLFLDSWRASPESAGPGGIVGQILGDKLATVLGVFGASFLSLSTYLAALSLMADTHPLRALGELRSAIPHLATAIRSSFSALLSTIVRPDTRPQAPKTRRDRTGDRPNPATPAPRARKQTRHAAPATEPPSDGQNVAPTQLTLDLPEPKIIDASAPIESEEGDSRPSLAEVMARRKEKKRDRISTSTSRSALERRFQEYELPPLSLLDPPSQDRPEADHHELLRIQTVIVETLHSFGVSVRPGDIIRGPTITRYEIYPAPGLRVSRITTLEPDLARATCAESINILAPIPGKDTVGIEIANRIKIPVTLSEILQDRRFQNGKARLPLALGKDVSGQTIVADLASMPHLLVAGATGSGKSVCINGIIASLIYQFSPDELRFIMVDPKVVEMQAYQELPHLAIPVVTDPKKVILALRWVIKEMERRYRMFAKEGVRNFESFNNRKPKGDSPTRSGAKDKPQEDSTSTLNPLERAALLAATEAERRGEPVPSANDDDFLHRARLEDGEIARTHTPPPNQAELVPDSIPYIVVIIDELADLMQTAAQDVEACIMRITQMARAAGIHLIVATQRPSTDIITGVIKANIPCRIAFQVSSAIDSRVILDAKGAEKLVGKGDMLYVPPGQAKLQRAQGAFLSDAELERVVSHCKAQGEPVYEREIEQSLENDDTIEEDLTDEEELLIERCLEVIRQEKKASTSLLQRRLRLGYTRAARMVDVLEQRGILGPGEGARPREILVNLEAEFDEVGAGQH